MTDWEVKIYRSNARDMLKGRWRLLVGTDIKLESGHAVHGVEGRREKEMEGRISRREISGD